MRGPKISEIHAVFSCSQQYLTIHTYLSRYSLHSARTVGAKVQHTCAVCTQWSTCTGLFYPVQCLRREYTVQCPRMHPEEQVDGVSPPCAVFGREYTVQYSRMRPEKQVDGVSPPCAVFGARIHTGGHWGQVTGHCRTLRNVPKTGPCPHLARCQVAQGGHARLRNLRQCHIPDLAARHLAATSLQPAAMSHS